MKCTVHACDVDLDQAYASIPAIYKLFAKTSENVLLDSDCAVDKLNYSVLDFISVADAAGDSEEHLFVDGGVSVNVNFYFIMLNYWQVNFYSIVSSINMLGMCMMHMCVLIRSYVTGKI